MSLRLGGADIRAKFGTNRLRTLKSPNMDLNSVIFEGGLSFSIEAVACGDTSNDPRLIKCPR